MEPNYKVTMELYEQILLVIYMLVFKQTIAIVILTESWNDRKGASTLTT